MRSMYTPKASAYMCVPDDSFMPVLVSRMVATSSACTVSCFNGQKIFQSKDPTCRLRGFQCDMPVSCKLYPTRGRERGRYKAR